MTLWFTVFSMAWVPYLQVASALGHWVGVSASVVSMLLWPFISAVLNILLRKKTPKEWETWALEKPGLALLVELIRATGSDPVKALVVFQRYSERRAGDQPMDVMALELIPVGIRTMLQNPVLKASLEAEAQRLISLTGSSLMKGGG